MEVSTPLDYFSEYLPPNPKEGMSTVLWYLMQICTILWLVHIYSTKITPENPPFVIFAFAVLMTYYLTATISFFIDLLRRILCRLGRVILLLRHDTPLISEQQSRRPRIHVEHKVLPRH